MEAEPSLRNYSQISILYQQQLESNYSRRTRGKVSTPLFPSFQNLYRLHCAHELGGIIINPGHRAYTRAATFITFLFGLSEGKIYEQVRFFARLRFEHATLLNLARITRSGSSISLSRSSSPLNYTVISARKFRQRCMARDILPKATGKIPRSSWTAKLKETLEVS